MGVGNLQDQGESLRRDRKWELTKVWERDKLTDRNSGRGFHGKVNKDESQEK